MKVHLRGRKCRVLRSKRWMSMQVSSIGSLKKVTCKCCQKEFG